MLTFCLCERQDELRVATGPEDRSRVLAMYARACPEYHSVPLWVDRLDLAQGSRSSLDPTLLSAAGLERSRVNAKNALLSEIGVGVRTA